PRPAAARRSATPSATRVAATSSSAAAARGPHASALVPARAATARARGSHATEPSQAHRGTVGIDARSEETVGEARGPAARSGSPGARGGADTLARLVVVALVARRSAQVDGAVDEDRSRGVELQEARLISIDGDTLGDRDRREVVDAVFEGGVHRRMKGTIA